MTWTDRYIGIPQLDHGRDRSGCDCWGLARLVFQEELGIELPSYAGSYVSADERFEVASLIKRETSIDQTWTPVTQAKPFDLMLFRRGQAGSHVGVFVSARLMLHVAGNEQSKLEDWSSDKWRCRHLATFRHKDLISGVLS